MRENYHFYSSISATLFKEELHLKPKLGVFCVLSKKCQHFFKKLF